MTYGAALRYRSGGMFVHPRRFEDKDKAVKFAEIELKRYPRGYSSAFVFINDDWEHAIEEIRVKRGRKN